MSQQTQEDRAKDEILERFNDACEKCDWGRKHDRTVIKIIFDGHLHIRNVETNSTNNCV